MGEWLSDITNWLLRLVEQFFLAIWTFFYDLAVRLFEAVLNVIAGIVNAFGAPSFMTTYSVGGLLGGVGQDILYFVGQFNIGAAFGVIGAAYAFRLLRKALTLGQW